MTASSSHGPFRAPRSPAAHVSQRTLGGSLPTGVQISPPPAQAWEQGHQWEITSHCVQVIFLIYKANAKQLRSCEQSRAKIPPGGGFIFQLYPYQGMGPCLSFPTCNGR